MPEYVRSFSNPSGSVRATGVDQLAEQAASRKASEALQREMLNASLSEGAANRAQDLTLQGSFQDRGNLQDRMLQAQLAATREQQQLANQGSAETARIGVSPQLARVGLEQAQYKDRRGDTANQRGMDEYLASKQMELTRKAFDSFGQPVAGANAPGIPGGAFQRGAVAAGYGAAPSGGAGGGDAALLQMIQDMRDPAGAREARMRSEDRRWAVEDRGLARRDKFTEAAIAAAAAKGDYTTVAKLMGEGDQGAIVDAFKPTPAEAEKRGGELATEAEGGFDFQNTLRDIDDASEAVRIGAATPQSLVQKANDLVARLVQRQIPEAQAKALISEHLNKRLPGLGTDIMRFVGGVFETALPFGSVVDEPFKGVGRASENRTALRGAGYRL